MIRYGLKHKKHGILGVEISYNDESSSDNKDFFVVLSDMSCRYIMTHHGWLKKKN